MASQRPASVTPTISGYLAEAAGLISSRVDEITSSAVRHRPPWMQALGQPPDHPELERQWLRAIAIAAAYREQFAVKTDDPAQPLGPHAEPGTAARKPYWHAAESVIAARQLAGLDAPASTTIPDAQARAQVAADIYRALPEAERTAIGLGMAAKLGTVWFDSRTAPDGDAPTRAVHTMPLADMLTERGHMMCVTQPVRTQASDPQASRVGRMPTRVVAARVLAPVQQRTRRAPGHVYERLIQPMPPTEHDHQPRL
jgi:hypothetical protein